MAARVENECGGDTLDFTLTPLNGFKIDLMGFRSPGVCRGCIIGLEIVSPLLAQLTLFRKVAVAGDSAEESGVLFEA
jgi:hypothetical protein